MKIPALISRRSSASRSTTDIDAEIETVELKIAQAQALAIALQAERGDAIRQGDVDLLADHDSRARRAALEAEIAAAKLDDLKRQRADAARDEDEAARRSKFDAGRRAAARAKDLISVAYPSAASRVVDILQRLQGELATIDEANRNLPSGEAPLESPEQALRGRPYRADRTVIVKRPVKVDRRTGARAISYFVDDPNIVTEHVDVPVFEPAIPAFSPIPLAQAVTVPAPAADAPQIWPAPVATART